MRISLTMLLRMVALLFLAVSALAVGLGRLFPATPEGRILDGSSRVYLSSQVGSWDRSVRFVESETGRVRHLDLPESDLLEQVSFSPWHDERGNAQVVGRWAGRWGKGFAALGDGVGIARLTYPEGKILERIETSVIPASPPCWFPGTVAKVLFAGGDGQLYRFAFEGVKDSAGNEGRDREPVPVGWGAGVRPGDGRVYIREICWADDARLGRRLIATLSPQRRVGRRLEYVPSKLWWLELDSEGTTIEAAGLLNGLPAQEGASDSECERMPTLLLSQDGPPLVAYLAQRRGAEWKLKIAPLHFDGGAGRPIVVERERRILAEQCFPTPPVLSPDGRWVLFLRNVRHVGPRIHRLPVGDIGLEPEYVGRPLHRWNGVVRTETDREKREVSPSVAVRG